MIKKKIDKKTYFFGFISHDNLDSLVNYRYYTTSFSNFSKQGIRILYFYKHNPYVTTNALVLQKIHDQGIVLESYSSTRELKEKMKHYTGTIIVNTFEEHLVLLSNQVKKYLGQPITRDPKIFLDKSLQRKYIGKKYPESVVKHVVLPPTITGDYHIDREQLNHYPYIIKPAGGLQSSGVYKAYTFDQVLSALKKNKTVLQKLHEKGLKNTSIIIEEFIDGSMYTVDYYVDAHQKIYITAPVKVELGVDYGIADFCNICRYISTDIEKHISMAWLYACIQKTVYAGNIKNTFVHHEFKITPEGEFKTIEINGRIGGFRLSMYQIGYDLDILQFPFSSPSTQRTLQMNIAVFAIYPPVIGICKGYNEKIIKKIKQLPSLERIAFVQKNIHKKIGPTKAGYSSNGSITIKNADSKQFNKDFMYIKKHYFEIIIL